MGRKKHFPAPVMNATNGQKNSGTNNGKKKHFPAPSWSLPFRCFDVRLFLPKGGAVPLSTFRTKEHGANKIKNIQTNQSNKFTNTIVFPLYFFSIDFGFVARGRRKRG